MDECRLFTYYCVIEIVSCKPTVYTRRNSGPNNDFKDRAFRHLFLIMNKKFDMWFSVCDVPHSRAYCLWINWSSAAQPVVLFMDQLEQCRTAGVLFMDQLEQCRTAGRIVYGSVSAQQKLIVMQLLPASYKQVLYYIATIC